ncbi:MAG TPA: signal recognition particle-docking protein FtsY [Terriglobia bacterium]|nr:signal recognition particle-docking protein FtsY [Terriglobia bacterium]
MSLFGGSEKKEEKKGGFFDRLKQAVASTKAQLVERIDELVEGKTTVDPAVLDGLESTLISADLGMKTTERILAGLRDQVSHRRLEEAKDLRRAVEEEILAILEGPVARPESPARQDRQGRQSQQGQQGKTHAGGSPAAPAAPKKPPEGLPEVIFVVGVNGVGKTTTIAKLANFYLQQGRRPLLCAADTFRAAANEQLEIWAGRLGIEIVKQKPGADPSAVIFDALMAAKRRHDDPVIVDTAGRLHTKFNLMAELEKMCRIAGREVPGAPHQVLLVIDGTTGQNGLQQARQFTEKAGATGIILTKLDGTAKGGIVVAIARELGLPIQFVGVGETVDDLLPFNPREFVESLFEA